MDIWRKGEYKMSYYDELNELYMEKVAARSYGRNPDGSRRTAKQLVIDQLGGFISHPQDGKATSKFPREYINPKKSATPIERDKYFLTNDGKYNFSITSPKRIELGRELKGGDYPRKLIRQHTNHENRLSVPSTANKSDAMKDNISTYSHNTKFNRGTGRYDLTHKKRPQEEYVKALKEHGKKDKTDIKDMIRKGKKQYSSKAPYAILAAGLLTAGAAETKNLYDKIKAKREAENKDKAKKTELLNA